MLMIIIEKGGNCEKPYFRKVKVNLKTGLFSIQLTV